MFKDNVVQIKKDKSVVNNHVFKIVIVNFILYTKINCYFLKYDD